MNRTAETMATLLVLGGADRDSKLPPRRSFFSLLRAILRSTGHVRIPAIAEHSDRMVDSAPPTHSSSRSRCSLGAQTRTVTRGGGRGGDRGGDSPVWALFWPELWTLLDAAAPGGAGTEALLLVRREGRQSVSRVLCVV
jgi:hypothetical protein